MYWTPCVRVDLPEDALRADIRTVGLVLDDLIKTLEGTHVLHLNLALSAAALTAFEREGFMPLLDRVCDLAAESRLALLTTAAHSAILPLLPHDEAARQLQLTEVIHKRLFGDAWHPATLWPTALAFSFKVADLALERDYSSILVDEAAMRTATSLWPGDRIDSIERMPGMFLVPCSRAASQDLQRGTIASEAGLASHVEGGLHAHRYVVTAVDVTPRSNPDLRLLFPTNETRTTRVEQLFSLFPLESTTSPLPCSQESTASELSDGVPFGRWFAPGNEPQALRWRLMTLLADALREATRKGIESEPAIATLRTTVDRCWRESYWREANAGIDQIKTAFAGARRLLDAQLVSELDRAVALAGSASRS